MQQRDNAAAKPLGVALVGYGYASQTFHAPLLAACDALALQVVVSSNPGKVQADWPQVQVVAALDEVLADPAIALVVIATPNHSHFALAQAALLAGKHVVVDKPLTPTLAEARQLAEFAAARGLVLSVFHNRRWDSDFLSVRALLASGQLGAVHRIQSRFDRYRPDVRQRWREQPGPASGLWWDLGPHLLDQALQLFGPPQRLWADLRRVRAGAQSDDEFLALLDYGSLRLELGASMLALQPAPRWQLDGALGYYCKQGIDPQEAALKQGERPAHVSCGERPAHAGWGQDSDSGQLLLAGAAASVCWPQQAGHYPAYYAAVAAAITGQGANPVPAADALAVMALLELGEQSSRAGCWLPLAEGALS